MDGSVVNERHLDTSEDAVSGRVEKLNLNILTVSSLLVAAVLAAASIGGMYVKLDNLARTVEASTKSNHDLATKVTDTEMQRAFERGERSAEKAFIAALAADIAELKRKVAT